MLRKICERSTPLREADILQLEELELQLPLVAELSGGDVFLDCVTQEGKAIVVAQARPAQGISVYRQDVRGRLAQPEDEPAVYHALEMQVPVRDLKARTQENQSVRQDVVPVFSLDQRCIAALIREKDITGEVLQEKKFEELARTYENGDLPLRSPRLEYGEDVIMREVHHRVKNNLQMMASILNLQARRCRDDYTRKILQENVGRVLSIAAIHDILTNNHRTFAQVDSLSLLNALRQNLQAFIPDGTQIVIHVDGDSARLDADAASSVSMVVNELITNALEHAFPERKAGNIWVSFRAGTLFHTITVADDGVGFDLAEIGTGSFGLRIVEAMVKDKLHGVLRLRSDRSGSTASFDFKTE